MKKKKKRKRGKEENGKRGRKKDRVKSKTNNILALVDRIESKIQGQHKIIMERLRKKDKKN